MRRKQLIIASTFIILVTLISYYKYCNQREVIIKYVLKDQRKIITNQTKKFLFRKTEFGIDKRKIQELIPENNGIPTKSVIVSTWRSGSTFLGDIINSFPANFYHYEPLLWNEIARIRGPPNDTKAIEGLKKLFNCQFRNSSEYLFNVRKYDWAFRQNSRLWRQCKGTWCFDPAFLEPFCRLFPFQSMKIVRMNLEVAQQLLEDESLKVKILLLVRDPRGVMQSRKHVRWCAGNPDCEHPKFLCNDMVSDYRVAKELINKYPNTFRVVRYEDLSSAPKDITREILHFFGLPFDGRVVRFLKTHTNRNSTDIYSTVKNSKKKAFDWTTKMTFDEVKFVQDYCKKAMRYWGYKQAYYAGELLNGFIPIQRFPGFYYGSLIPDDD